MSQSVFLIGDLARLHGLAAWQVRNAVNRAVAQGVMPEPRRLGISRVFGNDDLAAVEAALRTSGYLAPVPEPMAG